MALGLINGDITIRDKSGAEKTHIERAAPVWALCWCPSKDDTADILAVGCWDQTLSFYQLSGAQVGRDKPLGFDPCSVSCMNDGEHVLVGGSDKSVSLYPKGDGGRLFTVCMKEDWVWTCKARGKAPFVAVGGNDGKVSLHKVIVGAVTGVYGDRYAYRDSLTDVVVHHLSTEEKVRVRCREFIKKIGVYKNRLVVLLEGRILLYEVGAEDAADMKYKLREKLTHAGDCSFLAVTALHVLITVENRLLLRNFLGRVEREWVFDSAVRSLRVIGGGPGAEGVILGLKSGHVVKIFLNNPFPVTLIKQAAPVIALDLSASRDKLAVVDADNKLLVYDLRSGELLFTVRPRARVHACAPPPRPLRRLDGARMTTCAGPPQETGATSVAWNVDFEDMIAYSGDGVLSMKTGTFPAAQQKMRGQVVGFRGSKLFCQSGVEMRAIDVPHSASLYR